MSSLPGFFSDLFLPPDLLSQQDGFSQTPIRTGGYIDHAEDAAMNNPRTELTTTDRRSLSPSSLGLSQEPKPNSVDLRSLEYVGSYDPNLMCPICRCPFVQPTKLDCEHFFCRTCVTIALTHQEGESKSCPTCRRKTSQASIASAPKIIDRILDELLVRCPMFKEGCSAEMPRGSVHDHFDHYCSFSETKCPSEDCPLTVRWKDAKRKRCLHNITLCEYCDMPFMERDLESHITTHCTLRKSQCPHCESEVLHRDLETHIESCPEATLPCPAAPYGCDFTTKRTSLDEHTAICPLAKLTPFFKLQNERIAAQETAINHLGLKNSLLETSFSTIQETLNRPSSGLGDLLPSSENNRNSPFDSTAHHLLCLHESLREEVGRVSAALSELDANAKLMVINESLRTKEEFSHLNSIVAGMHVQLHWLISARLQKQHKGAMMNGGSGGGRGREFGSGASSRVEPGQPVQRLSDSSSRQETKL